MPNRVTNEVNDKMLENTHFYLKFAKGASVFLRILLCGQLLGRLSVPLCPVPRGRGSCTCPATPWPPLCPAGPHPSLRLCPRLSMQREGVQRLHLSPVPWVWPCDGLEAVTVVQSPLSAAWFLPGPPPLHGVKFLKLQVAASSCLCVFQGQVPPGSVQWHSFRCSLWSVLFQSVILVPGPRCEAAP